MKRRFLVGMLLVLGFVVYGQTSAREIFQQAENRFQNQDYELAIERYDALARQYPLSEYVPDAQYRKAVALFRLGRFQESLDLLQRVETRFRSTQYLDYIPFWKGIVAYHLGEYERATSNLEEYLAGSGQLEEESQARLYLALSYVAQDKTADAVAMLELLVSQASRPEQEDYAVALLLSLYLKQERYQDALTLYETLNTAEITSSWKDNITLYAAEAYRATGDTATARELYGSLKSAAPGVATVAFQRLFQMARTSGSEEQLFDVLRQAEEALAGRTDILKDFWLRVGIEAYKDGKYDLSELYFQRLWDLRSTVPVESTVPVYLSELYQRRGDNARAISLLRSYLEEQGSGHPEVLFQLGSVYTRAGEWGRAGATFYELLSEFPDTQHYGEAVYQYAFSLYKSNDSARALTVISDQLATGKVGAYRQDLLWLSATIHRERGENQEALQALREYIPLNQGNIDARLEYVKLLFAVGQYDAALAEATRLFDDFPDLQEKRPEVYVQAEYVYGLSEISRKNYGKALSYLERVPASAEQLRAISSKPDLQVIGPYVLYYRGWAHYRLGDYRKAIDSFDLLISDAPANEFSPRAAYLAGWSAFTIQDYASAEQYLNRLNAMRPPEPLQVEGTFLLGQTLNATGRLQEAGLQFRNVFIDHPSSEYADDAMYEYAGVLLKMDRIDEAVSRYRDLYQQYPRSPLAEEGMYKRGEILLQHNKYEDARNAFFEYRSNFPDGRLFHAALYWGGVASYNLGEASGALLLWEKLINEYRQSPFRADAMQRSADVYENQGEYRKALNVLTEFIAAYPDQARAAGARRKADELVLLIGGLSEREAALWVRIDENNRAETDAGRKAIIDLARMVIYEGSGSSVNESLVVPLLEAVASKQKADPARAAQATFLLAEYRYRLGDTEQAANLFLQAATIHPSDSDLVSHALYRAAEMMSLAGKQAQVEELVNQLEKRFPDSEWTAEAKKLLKG